MSSGERGTGARRYRRHGLLRLSGSDLAGTVPFHNRSQLRRNRQGVCGTAGIRRIMVPRGGCGDPGRNDPLPDRGAQFDKNHKE